MKKIYGIMALAGTMALASCSSDEPGIPGGNNGESSAKSNFINVVITPSSMADSRADNINGTNTDFKYGTDAENAVNSIVLGFYKADKTLIELVNVNSQPQSPEADGGNIAVKVPIAVGVSDDTQKDAAWIVAYVNIPESAVAGKNMTEAGQATLASVTPFNGYAMTSSVYYSGSTLISGTAVTSANFYKVGAESPGSVNLYVERVAAKVTLPTITEVKPLTVYNIEGKEVTLTFTATSWGVQGTEKTSYAVKQLPATAATGMDWVNAAANFRSYWAQSVNYSNSNPTFLPTGAYSVDQSLLASTTLNYVNYSAVNDGTFTAGSTGTAFTSTPSESANAAYVFENTYQASRLYNATTPVEYNPWSAVTSLVIKGTYAVSAGTNETADKNGTFTQGASDNGFYLRPMLMLGADGKLVQVNQILTQEQAITVMLNAASGYTKSTDGKAFTALTAADVELAYVEGTSKTNPGNARYLQIKSSVTDDIYLNGNKLADLATANASLAEKVNPAKYYHNGGAYFFVPLKHYVATATTSQYLSLDATLAEGNYGIVRNNWYELTVNKIEGLGTGAGGDTDIPLPDPEDDSYAIDAVLNVLQWHMRNQSVDL